MAGRNSLEKIFNLIKEAPEDLELSLVDKYIPKEDVIKSWSVKAEKTTQGKIRIVFCYQVGRGELHWLALKEWDVTGSEAQESYVILTLENKNDIITVILHQYNFIFDSLFVTENSHEGAALQLLTIFLSPDITASKVARRITTLRSNATKINSERAKTGKNVASRSEGAGSSAAHPRKPKTVPASSRAVPAGSEPHTQTTSGRTTPRRARESSGMTEIKSPPPKEIVGPLRKGETADAASAADMKARFERDFGHCFFMGKDFTFNVNINSCQQAPEDIICRAQEDRGVDYLKNTLLNNTFKGDRQTICVMPIGLKKKPKKEQWDKISQGHFYLIDGQHSVEASKQLQLDETWTDTEMKKKLQHWRTFVVWSDDELELQAISSYFNNTNRIGPFTASWAANIRASRKVWIKYGKPPKERENAAVKNPKWEVSLGRAA